MKKNSQSAAGVELSCDHSGSADRNNGAQNGVRCLSFAVCCAHGDLSEKCGPKKWGLLLMVILTFLSGLFGMVYEQIPEILLLHKLLSMACIVCLAIHLFVFQRGLWGRRKTV